MINSEIAAIFREIAVYLAMNDVPFKPQAYEKAALNLESLGKDAAEIYSHGGEKELENIPGIGKSIAEHIIEYIKTGKIKEYIELKKKTPVDLGELMRVEGLGPKRIKTLYQKLKIKNLNDLEKALKEHKIAGLEGFGAKSEENILKSAEFLKKSGGRFVLGYVLPQIEEIIGKLKKLKEVEQIEIAGSVRRMKETVGDCDILITSKNSKIVMDFFVSLPDVAKVLAHGETKSMVRLKSGLEVDVRVVEPESFGAAFQYFTGNKEHNIALRKIAIEKGCKLNEYGLFQKVKSRKLKVKSEWAQIAGRTEEDIYNKLGLVWIPPEMRENIGEIELAQKVFRGEAQMPNLINYGELKGDMQIQTNWSDGEHSIKEIVEEAMRLGLEYIVITDHTKWLKVANGLDEKRLLEQMVVIDEVNNKLTVNPPVGGLKFKVLKGAEVNILKDGSLDIDGDVLSQLDVVGAAVHSHFNLSREEQTERIKKAMQNLNIDIIFHPTGRIINKRPPYEVDIDEIIKTAKETGTILEIDAYPDRLDLKDEYIKKAIESGVKLAINSDAHNKNHMHYLRFGVAQARRGFTEKEDIINAWPWEKMLEMLK